MGDLQRFSTLFDAEYDLMLYDVTSTYFEGEANRNPQAQRGYSRDHRSDCKQVCIGLVVTRSGLPVAYEVFSGNRSDVTTVEEIVESMEAKYGQAHRIWVLDRGMVNPENLEFIQERKGRYIGIFQLDFCQRRPLSTVSASTIAPPTQKRLLFMF